MIKAKKKAKATNDKFKMRMVTKAVADLIPADYNPRTITKEELAGLEASIERFGYIEPIVYNKCTSKVIGGHQRLKVAIAKKQKQITGCRSRL